MAKDEIQTSEPVAASEPVTMHLPPPPTITTSQALLAIARAKLGALQVGDPVPFMIAEALKNAKGVILKTPPVDYAGFISEAATLNVLVDATQPQPGDIVILRYGFTDAYWSAIVAEVYERDITIIVAQSFHAEMETEVRELRLGWPNYNDTWHVAGVIRL